MSITRACSNALRPRLRLRLHLELLLLLCLMRGHIALVLAIGLGLNRLVSKLGAGLQSFVSLIPLRHLCLETALERRLIRRISALDQRRGDHAHRTNPFLL